MTGKPDGLFFNLAGQHCPIMSCIRVGGGTDDPLFSVIVLLPGDEFNTMPILCSHHDIERRKLN
jgi:hypothetical protein